MTRLDKMDKAGVDNSNVTKKTVSEMDSPVKYTVLAKRFNFDPCWNIAIENKLPRIPNTAINGKRTESATSTTDTTESDVDVQFGDG